MLVNQDFDNDLRTPARARALVREALSSWGIAAAIDTTALLVSELVTNAVKYGRGTITVSLELTGSLLRVAVRDADAEHLPSPREARPDDTGGRGVGLVQALAEDWGWSVEEATKTVWAEIRVPTEGQGPETP